MTKMVCHVKKYGSDSIADLDRHIGTAMHSRDIKVINPEYSEKNTEFFSVPQENLHHSILERISTRANSERAVRKDAVVLCEILVSLNSGWMEELDPNQTRKFFQTSAGFLRCRYREENCMYAVMHIDETLPHLHFGFVPMISDGRLSAKRLIDRIELRQLQEELPDHLRANGFQIERGTDASRRKCRQSNERDIMRFQMHDGSVHISNVYPQRPREFSDLHRENHNLRLEKLLLERQMKGIIDTIMSDPELEVLYMRQLELKAQTKLDRHEFHMLAQNG